MKTILKSALSVFAVAMFVCAMVAIFLIGFNHETYKAITCLCIIPFACFTWRMKYKNERSLYNERIHNRSL